MDFVKPEDTRALPPKVPNLHRWILIAVHTIPETEAAAGHSPVIGAANLVGFSIGCADCALTRDEAHGAPCLATPHDIAEADRVLGVDH